MKTNFFYGCTTAAEVQLRFDELSRIYANQDEALLIIRNEYSTLMNVLTPVKKVEAEKSQASISEVVKSLQEKINPEGIHLEICGSWLWLTGKTFPIKDTLKDLGFRYSKSKLSWYWRNEDHRSDNQEPVPIEFIREKFGSQVIMLN